jgi:hypothetical protein
MPIKNYTTSIAEEKTVGEIIGLLTAKGARTINMVYDERGRPEGVSFILVLSAVPIPFKLPCNFAGVFRCMAAAYSQPAARRRFERDPESISQSRRIAWRIIKDWVAAQMALIEAEQASLAQVFMPYCVIKGDKGESLTMFDQFMQNVTNQKALTGGEHAG